MAATPVGNYSSDHILLTFHGTMPGGDHWSCGLRTDAATPINAEIDKYAVFGDHAWSVFWLSAGGPGGVNPPSVTYDGCTARKISAAAKTLYVAESTAHAAPGTGAATNHSPNPVAMAITLQSNLAGRHGKGRFYIPFLQGLTGADGALTPGITAIMAGKVKAMIDDLNFNTSGFNVGQPTTLWRISIQSRTSGAAAAPVVQVKVGNILDTLRGRRASLKETYAAADLLLAAP